MNRCSSSICNVIALGLCISMALGCGNRPTPLTPADRLINLDKSTIDLLADVRKAASENRYSIGIQLADSLISIAPELPESHYEKGLLLIQLHQLNKADDELQKAISLDPFHRGAMYQRGHIAFEQRNYQQAIKLYTQQMELITASPEKLKKYYAQIDERAILQSWLQIGRSYELSQRVDSALWAYKKVLHIDSTNVQVNTWISALYNEAGEFSEALTSIRRAWKYDTGNPEVAYQLGALLFESGAITESLPLFQHAVKTRPWHAGAHYNLGRTLIALGEEDAGKEHLAITDKLQDLDQAIGYARAAIAQFPDEPSRWRELAALLGHAGRQQEQLHAQQIASALSRYVDNKNAPGK